MISQYIPSQYQLPCPIDPPPAVFMCAQPMQCRLREYVSFCAEESVAFIEGEDGNDEDVLARAWFPEEIEFDKTAVSSNH
jgi:hypothetical protein